jgi:uncharacterized protein (TIGR02996 family)
VRAAITAARRHDWPTCLSALLVEWRDSRDPTLASLIDHIGALAPAEQIGKGGLAKALQARIGTATDADVTTILATILREVRTTPALYMLVVQLAGKREADPRIAAALAHLVENPPFKKTDGALYGDVIRALDAIDDPRFRPLIVASWERVEPYLSRLRKDKKDALLLKEVAAAVTKRKPPTSRPALAAAIDEIDALSRAKTPTQRKQAGDTKSLLHAIYDDPGDVALRLVYADALLESGDPRGELITLQINRGDAPPSKRERELLKLHERTWLGTIEPIVLKSGVAYRNGFVARAREGAKKTALQTLLTAPEWATVEAIDLTVAWGSAAVTFLADTRWKALREVWGARTEDLVELARRRETLPWTSLEISDTSGHGALAPVTAFPSLVELDLHRASRPVRALTELAGSPFLRPVRRVRVQASHLPAAEIEALIEAARGAKLLEIDFAFEWSFAPRDGEILRLAGEHATLMFQATSPAALLDDLIGKLPKGTLRTVSTPHVWGLLEDKIAAHGAKLG